MSDPLVDLVELVVSRERRPTVVGVAGGVAAGKTTIATQLADRIAARALSVRVISTDAFLFSNAVLAERDLVMRKGFPESYDFGALTTALAAARRGDRTTIPVYSHAVYDIVDDEREVVDPSDVLVVEGVVALQPPVRDVLDVAVYVDAPEDVNRAWFVDRFLRFVDDARSDPASFYHAFAELEPTQVCMIAEGTWDGINGLNLREHIAPTRDAADLVVRKGADHHVVAVDPPA